MSTTILSESTPLFEHPYLNKGFGSLSSRPLSEGLLHCVSRFLGSG
jgi:hypothetical protein